MSMKTFNDKSMIGKISDILNNSYGISDSNAVGQAVAVVIFNRNKSLIYEADAYESLRKAITPAIVQDGVKHTIEIAQSFMPNHP